MTSARSASDSPIETPPRRRSRRFGQPAAVVLAAAGSAGLTGVVIGRAAQAVAGNRMAPWIVGRAAGITSYLLLVLLTLVGLALSHPWRSRLRTPSTASRIRVHVVLAVLTFAFTALHIVVLATDRYAGVGWSGALLPLRAGYRPVATTLGLIGLWAGLLAGLTASLGGRLPLRLWWPIHKVAASSLILVWLHGVFGGSDNRVLRPMYLVTGGLVLLVALSRYAARTPADLIRADRLGSRLSRSYR